MEYFYKKRVLREGVKHTKKINFYGRFPQPFGNGGGVRYKKKSAFSDP